MALILFIMYYFNTLFNVDVYNTQKLIYINNKKQKIKTLTDKMGSYREIYLKYNKREKKIVDDNYENNINN